MPDRLLQSLVHTVRRDAAADAGDAELLQRFVATRDAAAFELLVWRHGAMVEAVCRRVLGRSAEVEDAFQATFLALLKQARSIRKHTSVAGWLHCVALRVARRARYTASRRRRREEAGARPDSIASTATEPDTGPLVHEAIEGLPARFRLPLVLCHLEGRSVDEAARLLGAPRGTVLSRLARGRERLRRELLRRGVVPAVAGLALAESESTVSAALVAAAMHTINHGVAGPIAGLAQGAIRDMMLTKIKMTAGAVLAFGLLGVGTIFVAQPAATAGPDDKPGLVDPKTGQKLAPDLDGLQGKWIVTSLHADGKEKEEANFSTLTFHGDNMLLKKRPDHDGDEYKIRFDLSASPARIDFTKGGHTSPGIFELNGDKLRICLREKGGERPSEFVSERGSNLTLIELRRDKPAGGRRAVDGKVEDIVKLRDELVKVRGELVAERARAEKAEHDLKQALDRAATAEAVAKLNQQKAEEALKEAQAALDEYRRAAEKGKPEKKKEPDFDMVFLISQHWFLYIKSDGSGFVGIGYKPTSGIAKRVTFPAGTLDIAEARRLIENGMRVSGSGSNGFEVQLRTGKDKLTRGHISDTKITGPLFEAAFKKCDDPAMLKRLLAEEPLNLSGN
jgi:RNA polymerase sigma factor (sigma-70 family)